MNSALDFGQRHTLITNICGTDQAINKGKRRCKLRFFAHSTKTIRWTLGHWRKHDIDLWPM